MKSLTVLYDADCNFCRRCVRWLRSQRKFLRMEFTPIRSAEARLGFPGEERSAELTVIDDDGGVYYGPRAYIMCLYALREYRALSLRLASRALWPRARKAFEMITNNRWRLSRLLTSDELNE